MLNTIILLSFRVGIAYSIFCGSDKKYVKREYLCCTPVFNCMPGYEITPCTKMYQSETCTKCQQDQVQPYYLDSFSKIRTCFRPTKECTSIDLQPSRNSGDCYPRYCECNTANCFIDDHCVCVRHPGCPVNQTLDPKVKECVQCPEYTFKDHFGCGPCITDILLIRSRYKLINVQNTFPEDDYNGLGQNIGINRESGTEGNGPPCKYRRRKKCNDCKRFKLNRSTNEKISKERARKLKRCIRNRKRCLRRHRQMDNITEREN